MTLRRRLALLLTCCVLGALALLPVTGRYARAEKTPPKRSCVGFYFDTVVSLAAYTEDETLMDRALEECKRYENLLSKTVEGSDVWKINHAGGQPVTVSDETIEVLKIALHVADLSEGAFDMTIAGAVSLWDFTAKNPSLPDAKALEEAVKNVDYTKVHIDGNTVTVPENTQLDLGGVAKGCIADGIADFLREAGVEHALLNFGGNVVTIGEKPDNQGKWRIGIQDPDVARGGYLMVVDASDNAVVTSGTYERGFDLDGVRYHHILDPKTGWPVQNGLSSVTILMDRSGMADALSTATFILGMEKGMELIESLDGVEAIFITTDRKIAMTGGAGAYIQQ